MDEALSQALISTIVTSFVTLAMFAGMMWMTFKTMQKAMSSRSVSLRLSAYKKVIEEGYSLHSSDADGYPVIIKKGAELALLRPTFLDILRGKTDARAI